MAAAALHHPVHVRVGVFVRSKSHPGCILLGKRSSNEVGESWAYGVPDGMLESGESWASCAARVVLQGTGVVISDVRHGTVVNAIEAESSHKLAIFMIATAALQDTESASDGRIAAPSAQWTWQRWPLQQRPVGSTLAACIATGFDPFDTTSAGTLLHSPDDAWPPYCCCILHERTSGMLFLEQRSQDAAVMAGRLTCFGGKRERGESPVACIKRELAEELGPAWHAATASECYADPAGKRKRAPSETAGASANRVTATAEAAAGHVPAAFGTPSLRRSVDLYVDGKLIAWFFEADAPARDAPLTFEHGRGGVWLDGSLFDAPPDASQLAEPDAALGVVSPWHLCVLRAWRRCERRADFLTAGSG